MRVLYLNHTGRMSGAERALLELLSALPDGIDPVLAAPTGALATAARAQGVDVRDVPAAEASIRPHPVQTPVGLAGLARTAIAVARLAGRTGAELVHANSVRAGLVASLARALGAPPAVVYVHDCLPPGSMAKLTKRAILASRPVVLANSDYAAASFAAGRRDAVRTSYNGMVDDRGRLVALRGAEPPSREEARERLGFAARPLLGVVAQITPWKGQDTAIEALAAVRREQPDATLLLVGEAKFTASATRFDNRAYEERLRAQVHAEGLEDAVVFCGERRDALAVIAGLDVLLAPSLEEPFGRTIVEAMALGTPVVTTSVGGPAEIVEDGVSGRLVPPRSPELLAGAVLELLASLEDRNRFAERARARARRFTMSAHVEDVMTAYRDLLSRA